MAALAALTAIRSALLALVLTVAGGSRQPATRIVVNIPAFRLDVYAGDSVVRSLPVAVGTVRFPTPRGEYAVSSIDWNPWWIPPDSPWAAKERPTPPGPKNPMGRVKLNFRPLYFLHGTPLEHSIGSAASHGCIRLRNDDAVELARLVQRAGSPTMTDDELAALATDTVHSRTIHLDVPIPLELRYDRVEIRVGTVHVYRDVYGIATRSVRDELLAVLLSRGLDTTRLDTAEVRRLVERIPQGGRAIALDQLLRVSPATRPPGSRIRDLVSGIQPREASCSENS